MLTREGLEQTSTLRKVLYRRRPPDGEPIPILVQMVSIAGGPPKVEYIEFAVRKLRAGHAGGLSVMKEEHPITLLRGATRDKIQTLRSGTN